MIGISACLGGICCRYDGQHKEIKRLKQLVAEGKAILICPEVLGGLSTPREPAEIKGGDGFDVWQNQAKVLTKTGTDLTAHFKKGAIRAYQQLLKQNITTLILKEKSPSCGTTSIYDGSFSGTYLDGVGVATAYFLLQGIEVVSENNWQELVDCEENDG